MFPDVQVEKLWRFFKIDVDVLTPALLNCNRHGVHVGRQEKTGELCRVFIFSLENTKKIVLLICEVVSNQKHGQVAVESHGGCAE